jgi:hypothetical protein
MQASILPATDGNATDVSFVEEKHQLLQPLMSGG